MRGKTAGKTARLNRGGAGAGRCFGVGGAGILLLFGGCVVLWLCSLVFGFGLLGRLRTEGNVEWRSPPTADFALLNVWRREL